MEHGDQIVWKSPVVSKKRDKAAAATAFADEAMQHRGIFSDKAQVLGVHEYKHGRRARGDVQMKLMRKPDNTLYGQIDVHGKHSVEEWERIVSAPGSDMSEDDKAQLEKLQKIKKSLIRRIIFALRGGRLY